MPFPTHTNKWLHHCYRPCTSVDDPVNGCCWVSTDSSAAQPKYRHRCLHWRLQNSCNADWTLSHCPMLFTALIHKSLRSLLLLTQQ